MFFSRKKTSAPDLAWLQTDMHSHLVPAIDDGVPDVATSMELIRGLKELGYSKIITTPHILWDVYPNTAQTIIEGMEDVRTAVTREGLDITLHVAAEYFIDEHFEALIASRLPLLTISGNMVLVEFSMVTAPMDLQSVLFDLQMLDYQPVIAHPERYVYLNRRKEFFDELKNADCLFQLNLLSLAGAYGAAVQDLAEYLVKKEYYDLAGTDMHSHKHLDGLQKLGGSAYLKRLKDSGRIRNHLL